MYSAEIDSNFNSERMNNFHENEGADNCFLVFIGGKYVQLLDQVLDMVETISKDIGLHPLGLFITMENNDQHSQFTNHADFPLVKLVLVLIILHTLLDISNIHMSLFKLF